MLGLKLNLENTGLSEKNILKYSKKVEEIHNNLHEKKDDESEFLGWLAEPVFNAKSDYLTTESYSATTPQPPPNAL